MTNKTRRLTPAEIGRGGESNFLWRGLQPMNILNWWAVARHAIHRRSGLDIADPISRELPTETQLGTTAPSRFERTRNNRGWRGGIGDDDAAALCRIVREHNIKTLLEFGPGFSTYLFLRAGVERIVSCEHDPRWLMIALDLFTADDRVTIVPYANTPVVTLNLGAEKFDAAFVDSPKGNAKARVVHRGQEDMSRYNTLRAALIHAPLAFLHDARRPLEQATLARLLAQGLAEWDLLETKRGIARLRRLEMPQ